MRFHIVGIGGTGLSAVAQLLLAGGNSVSGSDTTADWPLARVAARAGAVVLDGFDPRNVANADVLIRSAAYRDDHPEIAAAREAGIPVWRRQDAWRFLAEGKRVLAVAGTHGKTTATALAFAAVRGGGLDPSLICGGELRDLGSNAHAGRDPVLVIEADEYDRAFLELLPEAALVTNVDHDHVDLFPTREEYAGAFREFAAKVRPAGTLVVGLGHPTTHEFVAWARPELATRRVLTYGFDRCEIDGRAEPDYELGGVSEEGETTATRLSGEGVSGLLLRLRLPGPHNLLNASGAVLAASALGVQLEDAAAAVARFSGTTRRLETLGTVRGVTVIDDYAHHPVEIRASILATRLRTLRTSREQRLIAVFQPHTASRLRAFFDDFVAALREADAAVVVETFASARESADASGGARELAERSGAHYAKTNEEAAHVARSLAREGDAVLILGAGDVRGAGERLLELLA